MNSPLGGHGIVGRLLAFTVIAIKSGGAAGSSRSARGGDLKPLIIVGLILGGIVMLTVGGDVILKGSVVLAETAGMSKRVIGLTVVELAHRCLNWPPAYKPRARARQRLRLLTWLARTALTCCVSVASHR